MSFILPNHSFIRLDRQTAQGGIGIAVHCDVKFRTLTLPNSWFIEVAGIEIFTTQGNFKFFAAYCPKQAKDSDGTSAVLRQELRSLTNTSGHFIIAGDLNAKHQVWGNQRGNKNGQILWEAAQNGLFTIAHPFQPTFVNGRSMSIIDIFMTNMPDRMNDPVTISALSSDHLPVVLKVENNTPHAWRRRRNFREADWRTFESWMNEHTNVDVSLSSTDDIDDALQRLNTNIEEAVRRSVPEVQLHNHLMKLDGDTKRLIEMKNSVRKQYQRTGDRALYSEYRRLAKDVRVRLEVVRNYQFSEKLRAMPKSSHPFWRDVVDCDPISWIAIHSNWIKIQRKVRTGVY